ncbi:MAG: thymidine phosphorylase [Gemmatimonadetes bacterium]|nr:thymidine phosphorylase [Gemmatimonadota bacterium]
MIPTEVIARKREGGPVPGADLEAFLQAYLRGEVHDYQMSAFLMAVCFRGLEGDETATLVRTMLHSGEVLDLTDLPGARIDKHSTGGVGDKVSLVLAPLAAAMGMFVPMMAGRGLGHTTGTLDKLEAIPGFRTDLGLDEFRAVVTRVGCAIIGQTSEIAPLDRRLYALRDVTGTVSSIPLIAASIMSKKLAEGLDGLLLDVKVGDGAFIPEEERALDLARLMVEIARERELKACALLTAMDRPLGVALGNGLETAEAIRCLQGGGPSDLRELVLVEATEMLLLADGTGDPHRARHIAESKLDGGQALERFTRMVEAQGGDATIVDHPDRLRTAPSLAEVRAEADGVVIGVSARLLGDGIVRLGGGRSKLEQTVDPGVGFEVHASTGVRVARGDLLGVVHARDPGAAAMGSDLLRRALLIERGGTPVTRSLVSHRIHSDGSERLL